MIKTFGSSGSGVKDQLEAVLVSVPAPEAGSAGSNPVVMTMSDAIAAAQVEKAEVFIKNRG